jgi:hypothetical protein
MIRRINHTGRKRINRDQVRITVDEKQNPPRFWANLSLDGHKFNSDAGVVIEAYRGSGGLWIQFDWGRIGSLRNPPTQTLEGLDSVDGLLFRLRVIAKHEPHKILGEADRIPFLLVGEGATPKEPLIKTVPAELGDLVWDVDFDADPPQLRINRKLGNWSAVAKDPGFRALVYPALFREILSRILVVDDWSGDAGDDDWRAKWIRFGRTMAPSYPDEFADVSEKREFIDAAVGALATRVQALDVFRRHLNPEEGS